MANPTWPAHGSSAHIAICRIVHLGGTANKSDVVPHLKDRHQSPASYEAFVIRPLLEAGFVLRTGSYTLRATDAGKEYAGRYLSASLPAHQPYVGKVAPGRLHNPCRELNVARHRAVAPFRPGSDDHRNIPSLMGSTRKLPSGEVVE